MENSIHLKSKCFNLFTRAHVGLSYIKTLSYYCVTDLIENPAFLHFPVKFGVYIKVCECVAMAAYRFCPKALCPLGRLREVG